jgi:hypothetical protein
MGEFDFLEPIPKTTVSVKLPSRGVLYRDDTPAGKGKIHLSPMTMVEESYFMDDDLTFSEAFDKILKKCVQEDLDINTLLSADKFFLFMMLRAVTYGPEYAFKWTCNAEKSNGEVCRQSNTSTVKIPDDFKLKLLSDEDTEPYKILLPDCQKEISFRLLRGHDEVYIDRFSKKEEAKKQEGIRLPNRIAIFRLARHITHVDGQSVKDAPENMLINFVASFRAKDRQYFQDKIAFYTPGLDTGVEVLCERCGSVQRIDMPFTADFFRAVIEENEAEPVADEIRPNVLPEHAVQRNNESRPRRT